MHYCPECRTEYQDSVAECSDCKVPLIEQPPEGPLDADLVDVYVCHERQHAERALQILAEDGIEAMLRDRASSAFPTTVGETSRRLVAVPMSARERAATLIQTAIDDGVIPAED